MLQQLVILASQSRPNQTSKVAPPRCTSTPRHYSLPTTHPARYFCASFVFMSLQIAPLGRSIWKVFIFMILRIPFFVSALYSHLYKLPGGVPFRLLSPLPPFPARCAIQQNSPRRGNYHCPLPTTHFSDLE